MHVGMGSRYLDIQPYQVISTFQSICAQITKALTYQGIDTYACRMH